MTIDPAFFSFVVVPILIFFSRIVDVSMDTVRIIFVSKGYKVIASTLGFFEVIVWLIAITQIMANLTNIFCYLAYGAGFAAGNYIGMVIEERLSIGKVSLEIVVRRNASKIIKALEKLGYMMTITDAYGKNGDVKFIYMVIQRKEIEIVMNTVKDYNPTAFYSVEEVRFANDETPLMKKSAAKSRALKRYRKEK